MRHAQSHVISHRLWLCDAEPRTKSAQWSLRLPVLPVRLCPLLHGPCCALCPGVRGHQAVLRGWCRRPCWGALSCHLGSWGLQLCSQGVQQGMCLLHYVCSHLATCCETCRKLKHSAMHLIVEFGNLGVIISYLKPQYCSGRFCYHCLHLVEHSQPDCCAHLQLFRPTTQASRTLYQQA